MMKKTKILLVAIFVIFTILLGFSQIVTNVYAEDRTYCDEGYYTDSYCSLNGCPNVKWCLLQGGEYRCCWDRQTEQLVCLGCYAD